MARTSVKKRPAMRAGKRRYQNWGEVVKLAVQISGRSASCVYQVLNGTMVSAPVSAAIAAAEKQIQRIRTEQAQQRKAQRKARRESRRNAA